MVRTAVILRLASVILTAVMFIGVTIVSGGCSGSGGNQGVGIPPDPDEGEHDPGGPKPLITSCSPDSGPVGIEVTISGTGFSTSEKENVVEFNGERAPVIEASRTYLITVVPEGASTGFVTVTVSGRTSNSVLFVVTSVLNTSRVSAACPVSESEVWVGTRGGLALLNIDDASFTFISVEDGLISDYIIDLIPFRDDLLVLTNKGLQLFNGDLEHPDFKEICPEVTFSGYGRFLDKMAVAEDGNVYLAHLYYGLVRITDGPSGPECHIFNWVPDPVSYGGFVDYSPFISITDIHVDPEGRIWLLYDIPYLESRLVVFLPDADDPESYEYVQYSMREISDLIWNVFSMIISPDGKVFIGTDNGYYWLKGDPFTELEYDRISPRWTPVLAYEQLAAPGGEIILATYDQGLMLLEEYGGEFIFRAIPRWDEWFSSDFEERKITDLAAGLDGSIIIGAEDGISRMSGSYIFPLFQDYKTGIPSYPQDFIEDIAIDPQGNLLSIDINSLCILAGDFDPETLDLDIKKMEWGPGSPSESGVSKVSIEITPSGRIIKSTDFGVDILTLDQSYQFVDRDYYSFSKSHTIPSTSPPWIYDMALDLSGDDERIYVATCEGLCILNEDDPHMGNYYTCPVYRGERIHDEIRVITLDKRNGVLLGTWCDGLWYYTSDDKVEQLNLIESVDFEDRCDCKAFQLSSGDSLRENFFLDDSILAIATEKNSLIELELIYAGTPSGLFVLNGVNHETLAHFPFDDRSAVKEISVDHEGNVFLIRSNLHIEASSYREDILTIFNGDLENPRFHNLDQSNGLPSSPYRALANKRMQQGILFDKTALYISINDGGGLARLEFLCPLFDKDGDGIHDNQDSDDDNDGLKDFRDLDPATPSSMN